MKPLSLSRPPLLKRLFTGSALVILVGTLTACGGGSGSAVPVASSPTSGSAPVDGTPPATSGDAKPEMRCAP